MCGNESGSVLIIDDDVDICDVIAASIDDAGHCSEVAVGEKDIRRRVASDWACIIIDLTMPGFDGIEVLRLLADTDNRSPIILISGFSKQILEAAQRLAEHRGLNIVGTLTKPIQLDLLDAVVESAITASRLARTSPKETPKREFNLGRPDITLSEGGLIPYYQPKICMRTGKVAGFEALARWWHPEFGILGPQHFLPQLIEAGQADSLALEMLNMVSSDVTSWAEDGHEFTIALNIEASSLNDLNLPQRLLDALEDTETGPASIMFEITETGLSADVAVAMDILVRCRLSGFELAIDDFGTGHSTLSQLQNLPFTQLKIDRTFVREIGAVSDAEAIIEATISLAHKLHMNVVAEGVETADQVAFLKRRGCDQLQGFFYAKPMNAADVCTWLAAHKSGTTVPERPSANAA